MLAEKKKKNACYSEIHVRKKRAFRIGRAFICPLCPSLQSRHDDGFFSPTVCILWTTQASHNQSIAVRWSPCDYCLLLPLRRDLAQLQDIGLRKDSSAPSRNETRTLHLSFDSEVKLESPITCLGFNQILHHLVSFVKTSTYSFSLHKSSLSMSNIVIHTLHSSELFKRLTLAILMMSDFLGEVIPKHWSRYSHSQSQCRLSINWKNYCRSINKNSIGCIRRLGFKCLQTKLRTNMLHHWDVEGDQWLWRRLQSLYVPNIDSLHYIDIYPWNCSY